MIVFKGLTEANPLVLRLKANYSTISYNILRHSLYHNKNLGELFNHYIYLVKHTTQQDLLKTIKVIPFTSQYGLPELLGDIGTLLMLGVPKEVIKTIIKQVISKHDNFDTRTINKSIELMDGHIRFTLLDFASISHSTLEKQYIYRPFRINVKTIKDAILSYFEPLDKEGLLHQFCIERILFMLEKFIRMSAGDSGVSGINFGTGNLKPIKVGSAYTVGKLLPHKKKMGHENIAVYYHCENLQSWKPLPVFNFSENFTIVHTPKESVICGDVRIIPVSKNNMDLLNKLINVTDVDDRITIKGKNKSVIVGTIKDKGFKFSEEKNSVTYERKRISFGLMYKGHVHIGVLEGRKLYLLKVKTMVTPTKVWLDYPTIKPLIIKKEDYFLKAMGHYLIYKEGGVI